MSEQLWAALPDAAPPDPWAALPDDPAQPPRPSPSALLAKNVGGPLGVSLWSKLPKWLQETADAVTTPAMRVAPAVGGALVGAAVGGPFGVIPGGAIGAGLGETGAQGLEVQTGEREGFNLPQIGVQTALGAIPVVGGAKGSVVKTALNRAAQGGLLGGVGAAGTDLAEGRTPSLTTAAIGAGMGTVLGGAGGAAEGRAAARLASKVGAPAPAPKVAAVAAGWDALPDAPPASAVPESFGPAAYAGPDRRSASRISTADEEALYRASRAERERSAANFKQTSQAAKDNEAMRAARGAQIVDEQPPVVMASAEAPPRPPVEPPRPPGGGEPPPSPSGGEPPQRPSLINAKRQAVLSGEQVPAQQPLAQERIEGDKVFVSKQPEPFREPLQRILDENAHFAAQRRGVQPVERTNAIARHLQVERQKVLPKGTALNTEELKAYSNNIATVTDRIETISKRVLDGSATLADQAALTQATIEQTSLLASAMGARAETGRALNTLKQFAEIFESKDAQAIRAAMKIADIDLNEVAKKLATLPSDAAKLDYLRSLKKNSLMDSARGVYFANILSGVRTHIRNVFGNTVNGAFSNAAHVAATGYDIGRSAVTGQARTMFLGELQPRAVGAVAGVKQGLDDALFTLQHGYTPKALGTFDVPRPELAGGGKNPFNWVGRSLEAEDQLFYGINYHSELYSRLYAKARTQGLTGDALADQVARWKLAPPKDVADASGQAALRAVFKEEPGKIVSAVLALKKAAPALDFVMPFVKTPANIIRQGIEATPLAPLTKQTRTALKAGGREQAEAVGRMATGTAALTLAWWASQGKISGTGPTDPEKRAALMESGWRPNSVKLGDTWVSFDQIQPLAQPLYAVAEAWEQYRENKTVSPEGVLGAMGKATLDQSFFSGLSDLNSALSDPDRYMRQFTARLAQGAVPFSGLLRNVANAVDTTVRQPKNVIEDVKAIVPGLSSSVDPRINRMGQEVAREGGAAMQLTPFNIGRPSTDPVIRELTRLKVDTLGVPPKYLPETNRTPKIELTIEQRKQMGEAVRQELTRLFQGPSWKTLDEEVQRSRIKQAAERARARIANTIRREHVSAATR